MKLIILFILNFYAFIATSQIFTEVSTEQYLKGIKSSSIAFSDIDGDNDSDLFVTGINDFSEIIAELYINNSEGGYEVMENTPFEGVSDGAIAFSDIEGDGDSDIIITGINESNIKIAKLYANNGSGDFIEIQNTPFQAVSFSSVTFHDVDGDNDQDVLITGWNGMENTAILYTNDGNGIFIENTNIFFEGITDGDAKFSDVDNDGDPDVIITGSINNFLETDVNLYLNNGSGLFSEVQDIPFEGVQSGSIAFSDIDGDDDIDVLLTGRNNSFTPSTKLYSNDGLGIFTEVSTSSIVDLGNSTADFSDIDGDGDDDLLLSGKNNSSVFMTKLYTNNGAGIFMEYLESPFIGVSKGDAEFSDIDDDGDLDILITGAVPIFETPSAKFYTNDGNGVFIEFPGKYFEDLAGSLAISDINNDGDSDVLITGSNPVTLNSSKLYSNYGDGTFFERTGIPFEDVARSAIAFADIDGDNDSDLLITGQNRMGLPIAKLYTNNGSNNFTELEGTPFEGVFNGSISFANIDTDDDIDLLITGDTNNNNYISYLYSNDGFGNFTKIEGTPFEGVRESSVGFTDLDNDGDNDLLILGRNNSEENIAKMYLNNGSGIFTEEEGTPFENSFYTSLDFSDIDGDNDFDIIITGRTASNEFIAKLYKNDGLGVFAEVEGTPFEGVWDGSLAFADVDNDNDSDVIITGRNSGGRSTLYLNDGTGNYSEALGESIEGVFSSSVEFSDLDNDGDLDLIISGVNSSNKSTTKLYLNNQILTYIEDNNIFKPKFSTYPNPATGTNLMLKYFLNKNIQVEVKIFDVNGRLSSETKKFMSKNQNELSINISKLIPGIYFLVIFDGSRKYTKKIIIQ